MTLETSLLKLRSPCQTLDLARRQPAIQFGEEVPEIMADAARAILTLPAWQWIGRSF
jgi:hypothetical protein